MRYHQTTVDNPNLKALTRMADGEENKFKYHAMSVASFEVFVEQKGIYFPFLPQPARVQSHLDPSPLTMRHPSHHVTHVTTKTIHPVKELISNYH